MKRTFGLGTSRIDWILPATKWFSMLLMGFPLLGQVFWILSWNYYFHYQYYYSIGGIICSELEFLADKCEDLTNHLPLLIKRNLQGFDVLSSPTPEVEPKPHGWKLGVHATKISWTDWNVKIIHWVQKRSGGFAVYEVKWGFVQEHGLYIKTTTPLTTLGLNTIDETFQMKYYIKVSFKGYKKYEMSNLKLLKKCLFIKQIQ